MHMVTFESVFMVGFFINIAMVTVTITYLILFPSIRPEQNAENKHRAAWCCEDKSKRVVFVSEKNFES